MTRTLMWWSTGAASAIAARILLRDVPDAIPADWPTTKPIAPACDFLCHAAEAEAA